MTIELRGLGSEVGGKTHIHATDLLLENGLTVLIGPTLAGKTSLMRLMAGLDQPSEGVVLEHGRDVTGVPVRRRNVAMVYQQFINYPSFTVYKNIASPLQRAGIRKSEIDRRVREVASLLHLEPLLNRLPAELSGGQQQRTAMARALIKDASLLLFDEPLANLDYKLREELRSEMREIFSRRQAVVVYATTEPAEALLLGGYAVVMDAGRVLQTGKAVEVYRRPATLRVSQVFSDPPMNMIDGFVLNGSAHLGEAAFALTGHLRELTPDHYTFGLRANHLSITPRGRDEVPFAVTIELAEVSGSETFIHVAFGTNSWVVREKGLHPRRIGERIQVFVAPRDLYVFARGGRLVAAPQPATAATAPSTQPS